MYKALLLTAYVCSLTACAHNNITSQARDIAQANKLIEASITPDLLNYMALSQCNN